jgi:hypothetical protein
VNENPHFCVIGTKFIQTYRNMVLTIIRLNPLNKKVCTCYVVGLLPTSTSMEKIPKNCSHPNKLIFLLSRALRVKNETSISENLVREYGPHLELGVEVKKRERVFV